MEEKKTRDRSKRITTVMKKEVITENKDTELFDLLKKQLFAELCGVDPERLSEARCNGETLLHRALALWQRDDKAVAPVIVHLLTHCPVLLVATDLHGYTPLHRAVATGHETLVSNVCQYAREHDFTALLANARTDTGRTALDLAAEEGFRSVFVALLRSGIGNAVSPPTQAKLEAASEILQILEAYAVFRPQPAPPT